MAMAPSGPRRPSRWGRTLSPWRWVTSIAMGCPIWPWPITEPAPCRSCWATAMGRSGPSLTAGGGPHSIAVGDFNRDGFADLVVANWGSDTVSVLLGNGDGSFRSALTLPVGRMPHAVAAGDFNGDGA